MLIIKIKVHHLKEGKQNKSRGVSFEMTNEKGKLETWRMYPVSAAAQLLPAAPAPPFSGCSPNKLLPSIFSSLVGKQQWEMQFRRDRCNWCNRLKARCCFAYLVLQSHRSVFDMLGVSVGVQGPEEKHRILHPGPSGSSSGSWLPGLKLSRLARLSLGWEGFPELSLHSL